MNSLTPSINIPPCMTSGTEFTKVNANKSGSKTRVLKYDSNLKRITFKSKNLGVIQLEWIISIKKSFYIPSFPNTGYQVDESLRLAIYYSLKQKDKILYLIAPDRITCDQWYDTLLELSNLGRKEDVGREENFNEMDVKLELWLKQIWAVVDKDKDGKIDIKEMKYFLELINIECTESELKVLFKRMDLEKKGYLDFDGTRRLYHTLQTRPEIQKLHLSLSLENKGCGMSLEEFSMFLIEIQKEEYTKEEIDNLYIKYSTNNVYGLSKEALIQYLISNDNNVLKDLNQEPLNDMNHPLSHYWIKSSHNTYLTGNQLNSVSSITMYKEVLLQGCRCVELDCWDGVNNEPVIYHGYTLTSKILFKDVIQTIKDNAFIISPYPVILSLEVHCNLIQQDVMAKHLKDILGDILITTRFEELTNDNINELRLPSPNQLLNKIILKGKTLSGSSKIISDIKKSESEVVPLNNEPIIKDYINEEAQSMEEASEGSKKITVKVSKLLSEITPYCQTGKFINYDHAAVNMKYYQMSSFSEPSLHSAFDNSTNLRKTIEEYIQHNERCLSRVYPGGMRIHSNNYNPLPFWLAGFQMVALNYQTYDLGMLLNRSFFRRNRQLGYVLKPSYMCQPKVKIPEPLPKKYYLHVRIISAQNLPKPNDDNRGEIIDPFIEVEMICMEHGVKFNKGTQTTSETIQGVCNMREELVSSNQCLDGFSMVVVRKSQKTTVVNNNGFNPQWNTHTVFMFSDLEWSFLRFTIHEFNKRTTNDKIGQYCISVKDLKLGYRHLPVQDFNGKDFPMASLFIYTALEEHEDPNILLRGKSGNVPIEHMQNLPNIPLETVLLKNKSENIDMEMIPKQSNMPTEAVRANDNGGIQTIFNQPNAPLEADNINLELNRLTLRDFPIDKGTEFISENSKNAENSQVKIEI
ncbi:PLC-like phosphodiesterase [Neoconidiobolus thromboides FSU 785]|nr:PLC-like phosphodiesterase [Neoconidiobolus thromboides FSU 785]